MSYIPQQPYPKSAFGDDLDVTLTPKIAIKAVYGVRSDTEQFVDGGGSGSITAVNGEFILQTGTSAGGYATLWSRRPLVYIPGVGAECRITGRFTAGVATSLQAVGMFSAINGMFFGYNGTSFGVMHRYGGALEIRTLTITAASSAATTATVTLNGTAYSGLAVTNAGGDTTLTAHEITVALEATAAVNAWNIQHIGSTIIFQYKGAGAQSGSYSLAFTAGTGAGTFAQNKAGAAPTETWTAQASWNVSTASWFDPTMGNLFKLEYAFLGYGPLKYSIFNPDTRDWELVHSVDWANANTSANFNNPSMRPGWVSASLGSTTNLTVAGASAMAALQGDNTIRRPFAISGTQSGVTTQTQILTVAVRYEFNDRTLNGILNPRFLSLASDSSKSTIFKVFRNPTVSGTTVHQYVDEDESIAIYDTGGTTISGGRALGTFLVGAGGGAVIDLTKENIELIAGDEIVITGQVVSGAASELTASLVWEEKI